MTDIQTLLQSPSIVVRVASAKGSTPREGDALMVVSTSAIHGTVGGGQLEYMAIDHARKMLATGIDKDTMQLPLGPEIGQCCGGNVVLSLARVRDGDALLREVEEIERGNPAVYVFGAGHVGRALAASLSLLPIDTHLIDSREAELSMATDAVHHHLLAMPESLVQGARTGSAFVTMTHDHALDFVILSEVLKRDAAYLGMIGSKTKRAQFERWYERDGGNRADCARVTSPIGGPSGDKRPAVIASYVAAEIMRAFETANVEETA
ncbi:MAG: xanthine dehydrogenase accessory protein XdhC [Pseudomonadota bacterium]